MIVLLTIGFSILTLGGVASAFLKKGAIKSYLPWLIMAPFLLIALYFERSGVAILFGFLSIMCAKEFLRATGLYADLKLAIYIYVGIIGCYLSAYFEYGFSAILPFGVLPFFLMPIFRNTTHGMLQKIALGTFALLLFGWFGAHLVLVESTELLLFLIMGVELADASAFLFGKKWGSHPFVSHISPNKTVEGLFGSLGMVILYVSCVALTTHLLSFWAALFSIVVIWGGGLVGDLLMSLIKREIGVKDMGSIIPGHGGLCDRLDSLLIATPLFVYSLGAL